MKIDRRISRELALQTLYALKIQSDTDSGGSISIRKISDDVISSREVRDSEADYARKLIDKAVSSIDKFDREIKKQSANWDLDRLAIVDRMIIQVALTELLYFQKIPSRVVINEALEISKDFSTDRSTPFINGVLDSIYKRWVTEGKLKQDSDAAGK